jgi:uncharacterized protein
VPATARTEDIDTTVGISRAHFFTVSRGVPRATLFLGHGAGGGVDAWDLQLLAAKLPPLGIDTVLIEQPWVVAGRKAPDPQPKVDAAWRETVTSLKRSGEALRRLVVGGRSTGARIACRTAASVKADAVLCLAFPLHPPGRPQKSRADELVEATRSCPVTVLQGERDTFGSPVEVAAAAAEREARALVVSVPWADHAFKIPKRAAITEQEVGMVLVETSRRVLLNRLGNGGPLLAR